MTGEKFQGIVTRVLCQFAPPKVILYALTTFLNPQILHACQQATVVEHLHGL